MNINSYIQRAKRIIREVEERQSGYDVLEITPNRANSQQIYQLAGTPDLLVSSASQFLAMTQYLGERFGEWDFEKWDQDFINCFPRVAARPEAWGTVDKPWGRPINQRPKFVELNNPLEDGYKLVAFYPDRTNDEECYPIMGSINDILNQAMHIMHWKWLSAELAHVVGQPVTEYIHSSPILNPYFVFYLSVRKKPPYREDFFNKEVKRHQFTIHYPNLTNFEYPKLKEILGGNNGLTWGQWKSTAWITDDLDKFKKGKAAHQIWAAGSTEEVAKKNLEALLKLTTGKTLRINTSHTDSSTVYPPGDPQVERWKSYKVYPKQFVVFNPKLVALGASGQQRSLAGKLNTKRNKFTLYSTQAPEDWSDRLREFLRHQ